MRRRIHFDRIDSSGTFRSGDVRLDVHFEDEEGNEFIWFPKWDDLRKLYAEAERVEEMNPTGEEDLERLKALKRFDESVIRAIAEVISKYWTGDDLGAFFRQLGYDTDYGYEVEENARTFPAETGGPDRLRKEFVSNQLQELNRDNYQRIIELIEKAVSPKEHIEAEERQKAVQHRLNKAIETEGLTITRDGIVKPIESEEDR